MKKKSGILLGALVAALATGTLTSCGEPELEDPNTLIKTIIVQNDGAKISSDFTLPSYVQDSSNRKYKLEWVTTETTDLLTFEYAKDDATTPNYDESLDDVTVHVVRPTDALKEINFYANLTIGEKTAKSDLFGVRILKYVSPREDFEALYDEPTKVSSINLGGYVLAKAGYMTYNNEGEVALYIYDDVAGGAYYIYNSGMSEEDYNALEVGQYVTAKNVKPTVYSGVTEFQYGDTAVDTTKGKKTQAELDAWTKNLTNDVLNNEISNYDQSQIITLKGAKVSAISDTALPATKGKYLSTMHTVLTVEYGQNTLDLVLTEGVSSFVATETSTLLSGLRGKVAVGDYVDVTGVLFGSTDIVALNDNALTNVTKTAPGWTQAVAAADALEIQDAITSAGDITLPTTAGTASVTYTISETTGASLNGNTLTINAYTEGFKFNLIATVTLGETTYKKTYEIVVGKIEIKTISTALASADNTELDIKGTVLAVGAKGYILADTTGAIYIYCNKVPEVKVNDVVLVSGKKGTYNGDQFVPTKEVVVAGETPLTPSDATKWTGTDCKNFLDTDTETAHYETKKVQVTGKLTVSGSYYNIDVDGLTTGQLSLSNPSAELTTSIKALGGSNVIVEGYTISVSYKKIDGVSVPYFVNMIVTSVKAVPLTEAEAVAKAKTQVSSLAKTIDKDYDLPATLTIPGYSGTVSVTYKDGETPITSVAYTSPSDTITKTITATITVGSETPVTQTFDVELKAVEKQVETTALARFELGTDSDTYVNGDVGTSYTEDNKGYTLTVTSTAQMYLNARDNAGKGCIRLGSSNNVGNMSFTVGADVKYVVLYVAQYRNNVSVLNINGVDRTMTLNSDEGIYEKVVIDTTTTKTVTLTTTAAGKRVMLNAIEFAVAADAE